MNSFFLFFVSAFLLAFGQAISFNSSLIQYSSNNWDRVSSSSQSFTSSDVIGASLGITLPNGTIGLDYVGLPRSSGAAYAVCIDCDLVNDTKGIWSLVNGNQPDLINQDEATPVVLFTVVALDPTVIHTITVTNIPDTRFNNTSQITFQSFNLKFADNSDNTTETSTGTAKPTDTSDSSEPSSTSDSAEPTTTPVSDSESSSSTASSAGEPTTTDDSEPTSSPSPDAVHVKASPTAAPSPSSTSANNGSADSTAATKTQSVSKPLIVVIVIICVLVLFCLAAGLIFLYRSRRKRADARVHDAESQAYGDSQWLPNNNLVPFTGLQEVPLSATPVRPRNPFEDVFPPDVPLELETPGDSTLMNKRGIRRPRSSFGNNLYGYPARR